MSGVNVHVFAEEWIDAFNARDLGRILSHYSEDIELISTLYLRFTEGGSDRVCGKEELRHYFVGALDRYPDLLFTLLEVGEGARGPCLRYHTNMGDQIAIECFELDKAGKASRVLCHYVAR